MHLLSYIPAIATVAIATALSPILHASAYSALDAFCSQMAGWNVITGGNFSTDNHVHGTLAVGGNATLIGGNAEINSHNHGNEGLRVNGGLTLSGSSKVLAGGATIVKNATTNTDLTLAPGKITSGTGILDFNGNGGTPKTITTLGTQDASFAARDAIMQSANAELLGVAGQQGSVSGGKLTFASATSGISVFTWDVGLISGINEVDFQLAGDSFIVVNVINTLGNTWNAGFNFLGGAPTKASQILWNVGVSSVAFSGSELFGAILAPDSIVNSAKQLVGSIYAGELHQRGQQIHYESVEPPSRVPEASSFLTLVLAATTLGTAGFFRRSGAVSAA